jgi:two-component system sensor histidine kinase MtrB
MRKIVERFRRSLTLKVILSIVLLTTLVLGVVGTTLFSRITAGIKEEKVDSAISEAAYTIYFAQTRLLASSRTDSELRRTAKEIVNSQDIGSDISSREIVLMRGIQNIDPEVPIDSVSNQISLSSIPNTLREKVASSGNISWEFVNTIYASGKLVPSVAVGEEIQVSKSGTYEMYVIFSLEPQIKALVLIKNYLWLSGLALLILITFVTWLTLRQILQPIREVAETAERLTTGALDLRINVQSEDEIGRLGQTFNEMARSIEEQIRRLENLSRVQQQFVSDVSHELRTPLTTIRMASDLLFNARESFDPAIGRSTELLLAQIDKFEKLLEDLLEVSRFDADVANVKPEIVDVRTLVSKCMDDLALVASNRSTSLTLECVGVDLSAQLDPRRITRVVRNLLTNAIEHSDGKAVNVSVIADDHSLSIGVRDHGVGIDPTNHHRVFDRFWRADTSRSRARGGTGLGLAIAQEDARLHNGQITLWSELNEGAHFTLTIPKKFGEELATPALHH